MCLKCGKGFAEPCGPQPASIQDITCNQMVKVRRSKLQGPCYNCNKWLQFTKHDGFQYVISSPQHAQANGKAEKGVYIIKQLLKKATWW